MTTQRPPGDSPQFGYRPGTPEAEHDQAGQPAWDMGPPARADSRRPPRSARKRERRERRRSRLGLWLLILLLPLAGIFAAIATFLIAVPPAALLKGEMVAAVKARTGRDLVIKGPASFSYFPAGLVMDEVELSGPPGMEGPATVTMKRFEANVALWPLLFREVSVERIVLHEPVFDLRIDKNGRRTWDFAGLGTPRRVRLAQAGEPATISDAPQPGGTTRQAPIDEVSLGEIEIENGTIRYSDERKDLAETISGIVLSMASTGLHTPLSFVGSADWSGERAGVKGALGSIAEFIEERASPLEIAVSGPMLSASFEGSLSLPDAPRLEGKVNARAGAMSRLAGWFGSRADSGSAPLIIAARIDAAPRTLMLTEATLESGSFDAKGSVSIDANGARPFVRADLEVAELDLNTLGGGTAEGTPDIAVPGADAQRSIEEILEQEGTKVKGYSRRRGWSAEPLDFTALGRVDSELKLEVGRLLHRGMKAGPLNIAVTTNDGHFKAVVGNARLYDGRGQGSLTIDARGETPIINADFKGAGVNLAPFLDDIAGLDWLAGTGDVSLVLTGQGASEQGIVDALAGTASVKVANGHIVGFNLAKILRSVSEGRLGNLKQTADEKTGFAALAATFKIKDGVAKNQDLEIASPLVRVTGSGEIRLGKEEIDYTVRPKLVADTAGQGGETAIAGIEIPVRVHGDWAAPRISPDLGAVLKDPGKVDAVVKDVGKKLKGKKIGDIVRGLLSEDEAEKDQSKDKAKKLLDELLGR